MFVFMVFVFAAGPILGWSAELETSLLRPKRQALSCEFVCTASNNACMERATGCGSSWECHYTTDEMYTNCDCGLADKYYSLTPGVAEDASRSATPWHVGIYQKRTSTFYPQLCTGVLIFKDVVITAASCVFDPQTLQKLEPASIKVAAKQSRDYFLEDVGEQKFDVAIIKILDGYDGEFRGYAKNVALLFLATPATRPGIHPICLYTKKTLPAEMPYLKLTGWGLVPLSNYSRSKTVKHSIVDNYDVYTCIGKYGTPLNRKVLTNDKFCVQFTNDTNMSEEDTGGPTCLLWRDRHHLVGILSTKLKTDDQFGIATRLYRYLPWIYHQIKITRRELTCQNLSNAFNCGPEMGCVPLTKICDGNKDCPNGADEDEVQCSLNVASGRCVVPDDIEIYSRADCVEGVSCKVSRYAANGAKYLVTCPEGYSFAQPGPKETLCYKESWNPPPPPCFKQCQPITSNTLDLTCRYLGNTIDCESLLLPNTTIEFKCKSAFKKDLGAKYRSPTQCREDGELLYLLTDCVPQCGAVYGANKLQPLISHGTQAEAGSFPWITALYWREGDTFNHKCGGTIISTNKVLTAAHCLFKTRDEQVPDEDLRVITGKYRRQWNIKDEFEQRFKVKRKVIGNHYNGVSGSYAQDIAVLVLTSHIELNAFNAPACLDLDNVAGSSLKQQFGYVAGWGYQEDMTQPTILRETTVGYLDLEECRSRFRRESSKFFTPDKFCALFLNGSATEMGDSGGGLTFIRDGLHFVYGIVSIKVKERNDIAGFTNIIAHAQWLKNVMSLDD